MTNKPKPNTRAGEALKPCPFCSDPMQVRGYHIQHVTQTSACPMRDLSLPEERIADWNTRPLPQPSELVETPEAFNKKKERCLAYVEQHWKWGNLTRLGIVNQLVRDGFRQTWAIEQADRIAPAANQAVAHITQLEAQIAKLQADGERLAEALEAFQRHYDLNDCDERCGALEVPISDLRRACQALAAKGDSHG